MYLFHQIHFMFQIWSELIKGSKGGQNIVVKDYFSKMSLDIMGEICFGYSFDSQKTELNPFLVALVKVGEGGLSLMTQAILKLLPFMWYMPFGPGNTLNNVNKISAKILDEVQFLFYCLQFFLFLFTYLYLSFYSHLYFQCFEQPNNFWKTNKTGLRLKIRFSKKINLSISFAEMYRYPGLFRFPF